VKGKLRLMKNWTKKNKRSIFKIRCPLRSGKWNSKGKYMLLAKFQAFGPSFMQTSNARYEATNRVDHLEMEEVTFERSSRLCYVAVTFERSSRLCYVAVTFERHQRLPSRWRYAINISTLKKIRTFQENYIS